MKPSLCLLLFALLAATVPVLAQPDRNPRREGPRILVYENSNFRGGVIVLYPGEAIENLANANFDNGKRANDSISSIRVEGGAVALLYEAARFSGNVLRVTANVPNLADRPVPDGSRSWNDAISSLRVEASRDGNRGGRPAERVDPDVIITRAYRDLLNREPDPSGLRSFRGLIIDQGWSEEMVRANIRHSDEFRSKVADVIIRRSYQDLLDREPDETGYVNFRRLIIEQNWTEAMVRDNIRRGPEYRQKHPKG
jgi:hypothetical protein